jgi:hypothetical protein
MAADSSSSAPIEAPTAEEVPLPQLLTRLRQVEWDLARVENHVEDTDALCMRMLDAIETFEDRVAAAETRIDQLGCRVRAESHRPR